MTHKFGSRVVQCFCLTCTRFLLEWRKWEAGSRVSCSGSDGGGGNETVGSTTEVLSSIFKVCLVSMVSALTHCHVFLFAGYLGSITVGKSGGVTRATSLRLVARLENSWSCTYTVSCVILYHWDTPTVLRILGSVPTLFHVSSCITGTHRLSSEWA
jgi:hypothetical protein